MAQEDEIRLIAYKIWEEEGCVNGNDCEHWFRAEIIWKQRQNTSGKKEKTKAVSKQPDRPLGKAKASKKKRHN